MRVCGGCYGRQAFSVGFSPVIDQWEQYYGSQIEISGEMSGPVLSFSGHAPKRARMETPVRL